MEDFYGIDSHETIWKKENSWLTDRNASDIVVRNIRWLHIKCCYSEGLCVALECLFWLLKSGLFLDECSILILNAMCSKCATILTLVSDFSFVIATEVHGSCDFLSYLTHQVDSENWNYYNRWPEQSTFVQLATLLSFLNFLHCHHRIVQH